jgi:hypothetical protein
MPQYRSSSPATKNTRHRGERQHERRAQIRHHHREMTNPTASAAGISVCRA